jgi:alkylation response protein AidB-like acyl-CoA dehydrogenase
LTASAFDEEAALGAFFADPNALACGSGVPRATGERVAGGVRINGSWANVSGCEDAEWATLAVIVEGTFSWALIPVADLRIERTWQMAGMRATGSHSLVAQSVVVPSDQVVAGSLPAFGPRLLFGITVLAPVVGAARGALEVITEMFASDRKPFMTAYTRMGESPGARQWLAEATHLVDRAERTMLGLARLTDTGQDPDRPALVGLTLTDAARDCRAAVERMLDLHGSSGFSTGNPLQRYWRDVSVGSRHPHLNPYLAVENLGAELTGTD